jgi:hypothetical protein
MFIPSAEPTFTADPGPVIKRILNAIARLILPLLPPAPEPMVAISCPLPVSEEALTVEDVARAMRQDGYSLREIARELGISFYMARKYVTM